MPVRIDVRHVGRSENRPIPIGNGLRFVKRNIISFNFRKKVRYESEFKYKRCVYEVIF